MNERVEMKKCPNCGQEVLAVAKKCKYCGHWMAPKEVERCPFCLELIPKGAEVCPLCHELIRPSGVPRYDDDVAPRPEPASEPDSAPESTPSTSMESETAHQPARKHKKTAIIIGSVLAGIGLCAALYLLFYPKDTAMPTGMFSEADAAQLHEFFFSNLGEPVKSLSDCEALSRRIKQIAGKKYDFIEDNLDKCIPVSLDYDDNGHQVFSFSGTRNAKTNPETYAVSYTDFNGKYGLFEVTTYVDGKQKHNKESAVIPAEMLEEPATIRKLDYEGKIVSKYAAKDINVTLYVDGAGQVGDEVKGILHENGNVTGIPMQGYVRWYASACMLILSVPEKRDDWYFTLNTDGADFPSMDLALSLDGFSEGSGEKVKLLRVGSNKNPSILTLAYDGKLYDSRHSYPIEMRLAAKRQNESEDLVAGYYYYKSKGKENFIQLSGKCYHGNSTSSVYSIQLHSDLDNAEFEYETFGYLWTKPNIQGGTWTMYNNGVVKKQLLFDLVKK